MPIAGEARDAENTATCAGARRSTATMAANYEQPMPKTAPTRTRSRRSSPGPTQGAGRRSAAKWGMLGHLGLNEMLGRIDDATRSNFLPYGFSGIMLGAALVFFAFIGFDSISTHSEEASSRSATCRSASSPRWSSARCCTSPCRRSSPAWSRTRTSTPRRPWRRRSGRPAKPRRQSL